MRVCVKQARLETWLLYQVAVWEEDEELDDGCMYDSLCCTDERVLGELDPVSPQCMVAFGVGMMGGGAQTMIGACPL